MTAAHILLAIRHKETLGDLKGTQGIRLLVAWQAIQNRQAAQLAYEQHLRSLAHDALSAIGHPTSHYDLEDLSVDILSALDLVSTRA